MGYKTEQECQGKMPVKMDCINSDCKTDTFWTDEKANNTCPECNMNSMKTAD